MSTLVNAAIAVLSYWPYYPGNPLAQPQRFASKGSGKRVIGFLSKCRQSKRKEEF